MNAQGTHLKGVDVHVEDAEGALLVDVTLPQRMTMSRVVLDVHDGVLRIVLPKSAGPDSPAEHSDLFQHLINPDASGV